MRKVADSNVGHEHLPYVMERRAYYGSLTTGSMRGEAYPCWACCALGARTTRTRLTTNENKGAASVVADVLCIHDDVAGQRMRATGR